MWGGQVKENEDMTIATDIALTPDPGTADDDLALWLEWDDAFDFGGAEEEEPGVSEFGEAEPYAWDEDDTWAEDDSAAEKDADLPAWDDADELPVLLGTDGGGSDPADDDPVGPVTPYTLEDLLGGPSDGTIVLEENGLLQNTETGEYSLGHLPPDDELAWA